MKPGGRPTLLPLTPSHLVGVGIAQLSMLLWLFSAPSWTVALPLSVLAGMVLVAPFFPAWRLYGPYTTRGTNYGSGARGAVALTFDDGPHPETTGPLLELLRRRQVKACFFQVGRLVEANPELTARVLAEGHELGNHSYSHDVLLMMRTGSRLADEIRRGQEVLAAQGQRPLCFRPPVGIVNPRLWPELLRQGLMAVGFSRRAMDWGNRKVPGLSGRLLSGVRAGEILLLHDCPGGASFEVAAWLQEVEAVLDGLEQKDLAVRPLSVLLGRPVMEPADNPGGGAAAMFYDGLARAYDEEQEQKSSAAVRVAERHVITRRLEALGADHGQVLEVGAGTGRFTLALAQDAREVTALDVSPAMLAMLEAGAREAGLDNITTARGAVEDARLRGPYDLICSFSALEYVKDLEGTVQRLADLLRPGGRLFFTTAHRGPLRLWVQLGNAMRQGIWLHARSRRQVRRALQAAGLELEVLQTHGLKLPLAGGMLLEVVARRP